MPTNVEISVFVPTIGRFDYLREALASVLKQKALPKEIIVGFNGCHPPDWIPEFAEVVRSNGVDFFSFTNAERLPITDSWRKGIEYARASYVTVLGDDDIFLPEFLMQGKRAIDADGVDVYGSTYLRIDDQGVSLERDCIPLQRVSLACQRQMVTRHTQWFNSPPGIMALIFKKEIFLAAMPREAGLAFDAWTLKTMAWHGYCLTFNAEPQVMYRVHAGAMSSIMSTQLLCDCVSGLIEFERKFGVADFHTKRYLAGTAWRTLIKSHNIKERRQVARIIFSRWDISFHIVADLLRQPLVHAKRWLASVCI